METKKNSGCVDKEQWMINWWKMVNFDQCDPCLGQTEVQNLRLVHQATGHQEYPGSSQNPRGPGLSAPGSLDCWDPGWVPSGTCLRPRFGPDVTERFLQEMGYALVVRSHQAQLQMTHKLSFDSSQGRSFDGSSK